MNLKRRIKCISAWLLALSVVAMGIPEVLAEGVPGVSAQSAVLLCAQDDMSLWEKNATEQLPMASTTKIMTALLALEYVENVEDSVVTITEEMVAVEGSSMGLRAEDEILLSDLAVGMLLASGNDAANSVALFLAGSQEEFARQMNERAKEIGMHNTGFVTPSGLDAEGHYSTAYDMALLAREALKNSLFREIASSKARMVHFKNPEKDVQYSNHNKLLWLYEGCIGVKTGFTKKSGRCLVSAAERDGTTLIAVTLNAPDDWTDHQALFEYGFSRWKTISLGAQDVSRPVACVGGSREVVTVQGKESGYVTLPVEQANQVTSEIFLPKFLYAPIRAGEPVGAVKYYLEGEKVLTLPILATESIEIQEKEKGGILEKIFGRGD